MKALRFLPQARDELLGEIQVEGFPFGVVYQAGDAEVLVVAIADSRRKPDYWARRVTP